MAKILGIDYGEKRLGFAVSDPDGIIAMPLRVVTVRGEGDALTQVVTVCEETHAEAVVIGLPFNMNGTEGPSAQKVRAFIERLKQRISIPIHTWDERMTSRIAEQVLIQADTRRAKRKMVIDKLSAQLILRDYLDAGAQASAEPPAEGWHED